MTSITSGGYRSLGAARTAFPAKNKENKQNKTARGENKHQLAARTTPEVTLGRGLAGGGRRATRFGTSK